MVALPAGEALARDFLKLEARRSELEEQRWRFVEEMQNRHTVQEQRRVASLSVLDRRLRTEEKQHCLLKERNSIIRQQAAALCNPRTSEVQHRIRAFRERFALDAERQSMDWNRHIETQLREEIAHCRRDAQHCRQQQGEAMEVAMQQERLMVELAEAQGQAQEERAKLQEDVKLQQDRLRQRLSEQRQMMDDRVKAAKASGNLPGASQTLKPQEVNSSDPFAALPLPGVERERTALPTMVPARETVQADPLPNLEVGQSRTSRREGFTGYVPKEGTRQAEVYRQLQRNEAEMAADLRLMEDRLVVRCLQCGFVGSPPGPANGLCDCGHFIEVLRVPPKIAQGKILQSGKLPTPTSTVSSKVFNTRPAAPAFAVRGDAPERSSGAVTQPAAGQRLPSRLDPMEAAQEVAARSLERLAARRQELTAAVQPEAVDVDPSSRGEQKPKTLEPSETAGLTDVITSPLLEATSGDLGILDVPVAPLQISIRSSQPRTMSGNDWYDGGSSTPTPRVPEIPEPEKVIQETSSEDIAFEDHKDPTASEPSSSKAPLSVFSAPKVSTVPVVSTVPKTSTETVSPQTAKPTERTSGLKVQDSGNAGGPVTQPNQTGPSPCPSNSCSIPPKPEAKQVVQAMTEAADAEEVLPKKSLLELKEPEKGEQVAQVMETRRPLQNDSPPLQRKEVPVIAESLFGAQVETPKLEPDNDREGFAQVSSPDGSFTFGGMMSPPDELADTNRALLQPVSEKDASLEVQKEFHQSKTRASEASKECLAKESKLMSDLGLEDGSEDDLKVDDPPVPTSSLLVSKQASKRSNPLRGRGAGIMQASCKKCQVSDHDSFLGPISGIRGLSAGATSGVGRQEVSAVSKLKAPRPKPTQPSLFSPIDWGQKEDFR